MLKAAGEVGQALLGLGAHRMVGIDGHVDAELAQAVDDGVGELFVEPGHAQNPAGALVDHGPDQVLIGVERAARPADDRIDHRHVPLRGDRGSSVWPSKGAISTLRMRWASAALTMPPRRS